MGAYKLKAIFFDIDDTLYSTTEFADLARRNSLEAMRQVGLNISAEALYKELQDVIAEFSSNYQHHFDKLLLRLPTRSYNSINPAILVASAVVAYHETKSKQLKPYPEVMYTLKRLAKTRLIRGIITAGLEIKQAEKLIRLGIYHLLTPNAIFISDQIGVGKPNIKLYQRACEELAIRACEAIYVGDNPLADIDPPNQIGMITVRSRRSGRYEGVEGKTRPTYEIRRLTELLKILRRDFSVRV
jgi:putative hydrolase of the HAD superfamily